jgi:predicted DNA-binding transcriptional regulator AlpA
MMEKNRKAKLRAGARKAKRPSIPAAAIGPLPETGFVRQPVVLRYIPWSKSTLWEKIARKEFPAPRKISSNISAWKVEDLRREIAKLGGSAA